MRADRGPTRTERRRAAQRKRKNKLLIFMLLILLAFVSAEVFTLKTITNIDSRFTRSVERGVYDGWALDHNETTLQSEGRITDAGFIDAEYEAISEFASKKYKDDALGHLANEYISALKDCRHAAASHNPAKDPDAFWSSFSEPYGRRVKALYNLHAGDFDLTLDNEEFSKETAYLTAQGWMLDTIDNLSFNKFSDGKNLTFKTRIKNESGMDIELLDLEVELTDKNGKVLETSSVYLTDVKAGEAMDLSFMSTSGKAAKYRIISETFRFTEPPEPADTEVEQE